MTSLLDVADSPDRTPEQILVGVGTVVTRFDRQDSGNLSYGVVSDGVRYFVKTAGRPDDTVPLLSHGERVALLHNAVRLARGYPHPALPTLRRVIGSAHGPLLVYDWADGDLLHGSRDDRTSAWQQLRALPVERVLTCLDTIIEVHDLLGAGGEVACDFYDGCLIYDFATHRLSIIDLDTYQPGPFRNEMGRMFGSDRFMAPEEFALGALIDQRTSVFTLGRTVLLLAGDGTADPAAFRGPAPLLAVATTACRTAPADRHPDLPAFCAAWRTARTAESGPSGD